LPIWNSSTVDRADVLAVGGDHRHPQAGDADIEHHLGGGVDESQPHPLARDEQPRPVVVRAMAVDQEGQDGGR
jgi:hypothetical protein